jgi:CubicO group peptidase (beta-lactamase class C family)
MQLSLTRGSGARFSAVAKQLVLQALRIGLSIVYLLARPSAATLRYLRRYVLWNPSGTSDWQRFAARPIRRAQDPMRYPADAGRALAAAQHLQTVGPSAAGLPATVPLRQLLEQTGTTAFLVIDDGQLVHESYFNGHRRDSMTRAFSISKSATSALVGAALSQGLLASVDDTVLRYLPELRGRGYDAITIRHVLMMTGGLRAPWGRSPWAEGVLAYWHPDTRAMIIKGRPLAARPDAEFQYNDFCTCMVSMVLERACGMSIAAYFARQIWEPIGAEFDASWSLDHEGDGLENGASGLNARAIDLAKLGTLYLNGGHAGGRQVLPAEWVAQSVAEPPANAPGRTVHVGRDLRYYAFGWWGHHRAGGATRYWAEGHRGQFIYCCPDKNLVITRFGAEPGFVGTEWPNLLGDIADNFPDRR